MSYTFSAPPIGGGYNSDGTINVGTILTDTKTALRISDTTDDDRLSLAIDSASRKIETHCHRRFWQDPAPRTDSSCTTNVGSNVVLDAGAVSSDVGRGLTDSLGFIPTTPPTIVSSVSAGVSFTMSDLAGNPVNATGHSAADVVTVGLSPRRFICEDQQLVEVDDFFTMSGLVVRSDYAGDGSFGTTWTPSDYQLEPVNGLYLGEPWPFNKVRAVRSLYFPMWGGIAFPKPKTQALVLVAAQWGWPLNSFADVYQACIIQAITIFKAPDVPFGATPFGESGVLRLKAALHPEAESLLEPYTENPDDLYVG